MKITKLTLALLAGAVAFVSCNDDDDINEGRFDRAELYATSNTNGAVTVYDFSDKNDISTTTLLVPGSTDNEGVVYDADADQLIFASRTLSAVAVADNIEDAINGSNSSLTTSLGSANLKSPRSVAVKGNFIVVADNDSNELFIYQKAGATATLRNTVNVDIKLWGIQFDDDNLYAIVDSSNELAIFNNFLSNVGNLTVTPTKQIKIEGIVRTHGLVYNNDDDVMVLTDIGAASGVGSDTDGAFHIIEGFTNKFNNVANNGTLAIAGNQVRVSGPKTNLGNPISASYDEETKTIFIAERANAGGRILGFNVTASGDATPTINNLLPGANSVFFYGED